MRRTSEKKSSRSISIATWIGSVAGVAGVIATIITQNPPETPTSSRTPTSNTAESPANETPAEFPETESPAKEALVERVSKTLNGCRSVGRLDAIKGSELTLRCNHKDPSASGFDVRVAMFPDAEALNKFINAEQSRIRSDDPTSISEDLISAKGIDIGHRIRYANNFGKSRLIWAFENDYFVDSTHKRFAVVVDSDDQVALYEWWDGNLV